MTSCQESRRGCERSKFRIILDVGHTAETPGAKSAHNVGELDFSLELAKRIEEVEV